jgi:hypothetical protein
VAELQSVSMFRDEKRWDGWRQFDNAQHQRNTIDSGEYEVQDFVPISPDEATAGVEALRQMMQETGEASDADESLFRKLEELANDH